MSEIAVHIRDLLSSLPAQDNTQGIRDNQVADGLRLRVPVGEYLVTGLQAAFGIVVDALKQCGGKTADLVG